MIRLTTIFALLILIGGVFGLFQIKFKVQDLRNDIVETNRQLKQEIEAIHVLKAEWTYLNQPDRLRQLAQKYLQLETIKMAQMHKLEDKLPIHLAENENKRELYLENFENIKQASISNPKNNLVKNVKFKVVSDVRPEITKVSFNYDQ